MAMSDRTYALLTRVKTRPGTARKPTLAIRLAGEGMAIEVVAATAREQATCISAKCRARATMGFLLARRDVEGGWLVLVFACEKHHPTKEQLAAGEWAP